ncbi:unnamed protein product, partial [Allacma fusca]
THVRTARHGHHHHHGNDKKKHKDYTGKPSNIYF